MIRSGSPVLSRIASARPAELIPWTAPVVVAVTMRAAPRLGLTTEMLFGLVAFVALIAVVHRAPIAALAAAIVFLPFENVALSYLYRLGAPEALLDQAGAWKEAVLIGVVLAAVSAHRRSPRPLDRLDRVGLAYIVVCAAYVAAPRLLTGETLLGLDVRLIAARESVSFIVLLLAVRRLADTRATDLILRALTITGTVIALIGMGEFSASDTWNSIMVDDVQYPRYALEVLEARLRNATDLRAYSPVAGQSVLRLSTVFFDPLATGFFLAPTFVILCERVATGRARLSGSLGLGVVGLALVLTQTRSAILAGAVGALVALRPHAQRSSRGRAQLAALGVAAAIVLFPLVASSGVIDRIAGGASGTEESVEEHKGSFWDGVHAAAEHPLGLGFGRAGASAVRFQTDEGVISENYYLQIANETGVLSAALFVGITVLTVRWVRRAATTNATALPVGGALLGLAVGGWFLHVWKDLAVSWPMWTLAGLAIGAASHAEPHRRALTETTPRESPFAPTSA